MWPFHLPAWPARQGQVARTARPLVPAWRTLRAPAPTAEVPSTVGSRSIGCTSGTAPRAARAPRAAQTLSRIGTAAGPRTAAGPGRATRHAAAAAAPTPPPDAGPALPAPGPGVATP